MGGERGGGGGEGIGGGIGRGRVGEELLEDSRHEEGTGDEGGEVTIFGAETVAEPSPPAGAGEVVGTGVHAEGGGVVAGVAGVHAANEGDFFHASAAWRE